MSGPKNVNAYPMGLRRDNTIRARPVRGPLTSRSKINRYVVGFKQTNRTPTPIHQATTEVAVFRPFHTAEKTICLIINMRAIAKSEGPPGGGNDVDVM